MFGAKPAKSKSRTSHLHPHRERPQGEGCGRQNPSIRTFVGPSYPVAIGGGMLRKRGGTLTPRLSVVSLAKEPSRDSLGDAVKKHISVQSVPCAVPTALTTVTRACR